MPTSVPSLRRRPRIAPNGRPVSRRSPTLSMIQCKLAMWVSCVRIPLDHVNTSAKVGAHSHELFSPVAGLLFEIHRWRGARHKQIIWPTHNKDSRLLRDKKADVDAVVCVCVCVCVRGLLLVAWWWLRCVGGRMQHTQPQILGDPIRHTPPITYATFHPHSHDVL